MRAVTYRGPSHVRVDAKPDPVIEHPRDAILRVTTTAICGSDLHLYHGLIPDTRVGMTFGHEFVGVIEEVGEAITTLAPGDRVIVPFNISCGSCFFCSRGLTANCENTNPNASIASGCFGYSHTTGGFDGGQAEYVRVPFADVGPYPIPDDMSDEDVLFLTDIFPTGYLAAEMGEIDEGDTVILFGAGPVGLFAAKSAALMGAGRVIVVDHLDYRLAKMRQFVPGVETVNYTEHDDVLTHLRELTGMRGADVCIDAVGCEASGSLMHSVLGKGLKLEAGAATALQWCIETVRKAGTVSIVGVYGPPWNMVPIGTAMNKGLTLRMNQCNVRRYIPRLLEHIREGRVDPTAIITHRVSLDDAPEMYRVFASKDDDCVKVVMTP